MLLAVAPVVVVGCASGHRGSCTSDHDVIPVVHVVPFVHADAQPDEHWHRRSPKHGRSRHDCPGQSSSAALARGPAIVPFQSPLPPHLRVRGVGTWTYIDAGHVGSGYVGSAQVLIRSSIEGETVTAIYDVFTAASQARAEFSLAESNFSRFSRRSPAGSFRLLRLSPAVSAFCGPQAAPANTTTCWFDYTATNGIVTTTAPPVYSGDGPAVLQAMLSHVLALTG